MPWSPVSQLGRFATFSDSLGMYGSWLKDNANNKPESQGNPHRLGGLGRPGCGCPPNAGRQFECL